MLFYVLLTVVFLVVALAAYAIGHTAGHHGYLNFMVIAFLVRLVIGAATFGLAYTAAFLRDATVRSGFQSDVGILVLTVIVTIGAAVGDYVMYRGVDIHELARRMDQTFGNFGVDDQTLFSIDWSASLLNLASVPPLCWAVLQILGLVTIPLRLLFPKILRARPLVPSYGVPAK
jgi:hypothetical protein